MVTFLQLIRKSEDEKLNRWVPDFQMNYSSLTWGYDTSQNTHGYHGHILLAQIKFYPSMDEQSNAQQNVCGVKLWIHSQILMAASLEFGHVKTISPHTL